MLEDLRYMRNEHGNCSEKKWWAGGDLNSRSPGALLADNESARPKPGIIFGKESRVALRSQSRPPTRVFEFPRTSCYKNISGFMEGFREQLLGKVRDEARYL